MDQKGFQEYRDQKEQTINAMSQGELLLLLYDELVKRLMQAELALGKENYSLFETSVGRSLEIIRYLDDTLDRQYPAEIWLNYMNFSALSCSASRRAATKRSWSE